MSERTKCNHCSFQDMKKRAADRAAEITVIRHSTGMWEGWVEVRSSDKEWASTFFKSLTDHCVC